MIDLLMFITLLVMSIRIVRAINKNAAIFSEFNQPKILSALVMLYPAGPLLLFLDSAIQPLVLQYILVAVCYLPGLIVAFYQQRVFESAGTSRVVDAKNSISLATGGAILGLLYLLFVIVFSVAITAYSGIID